MNKDRPSPARVLVIAGFALSCFGLLLFLWLAFGGSIPLKPKGYRIQVAFPEAATLADQADVRIAGVPVGKVVKLARDTKGGNRTLATLEIFRDYAPVRKDAKAILRQKTLLGETYVEMTRGLKAGDTIPENGRLRDGQVGDPILFDEMLRLFDEPTRRAFRDWQAVTSEATKGRAVDINDLLGNLPAFVEDAHSVTKTLNRRREALSALVRNTGTTFEALTRNGEALQTLVVRNRQVFDELAARRAALTESVRIFPTFLRETRTTFRRLEDFAEGDAEPTLRELEPVLEDLRPTLRSVRDLAPDAERLFRNLDPLIEAGRVGLPSLARILRELDPTLAEVIPFLQQLNPVLEFLEVHQQSVSDFLNIGPSALAGIRTPTPGTSSNGHVLPQLVMLGSQSMATATRTPDNRGTSYFRPGALADPRGKDVNRFILPNWDCAHVGGEKPPTETPGCYVQGPFNFNGQNRSYPHVGDAAPGAGTEAPATTASARAARRSVARAKARAAKNDKGAR